MIEQFNVLAPPILSVGDPDPADYRSGLARSAHDQRPSPDQLYPRPAVGCKQRNVEDADSYSRRQNGSSWRP
jgi:hypothetical protein